jgi:hypothetical protein
MSLKIGPSLSQVHQSTQIQVTIAHLTNYVDMMENWPAMQKWTNSYLKQKAGNAEVTVDVTPSGYGDHVVDDKYFVKPLEKKMKFGTR